MSNIFVARLEQPVCKWFQTSLKFLDIESREIINTIEGKNNKDQLWGGDGMHNCPAKLLYTSGKNGESPTKTARPPTKNLASLTCAYSDKQTKDGELIKF